MMRARKLTEPKSAIGRYLNSTAIALAACGIAFSWYYINFAICAGAACGQLAVTSIWLTLSPVLLLLAACGVGLALYVRHQTALPSLISDLLAALMLLVCGLTSVIPVTVLAELRRLA